MTETAVEKSEATEQPNVDVDGANAYRWDGEFRDRALDAQFLTDTWAEIVARSRAVMVAAILFVIAGGIDYMMLGFGPEFLQLFALRILTLIVAFVPIILFSDGADPKAFHVSVTFTEAYLFAVFLISAVAGTTAMRDLAVTGIVILFAYYIAVPNRLVFNTLVAVPSSIALVVTVAFRDDATVYGVSLLAGLFLAVNVIGVQLGRLWGRLRRSEYLSMRHHKQMSGRLAEEIAERQVAETEARANERSFEGVFRAAPLPLALMRPGDSHILQANKAARELLGVTAAQVKQFELSSFIDSELAGDELDHIGALLDGSEPVEIAIRTADGRDIWVNVSTSALRYRGAPAILIALHDVTSRRMEAVELREARDHADAANRSKTEFLANMSHELRTPLNAIIGFSEALEREIYGPLGNERYSEYAQDIHNSGVHLLNIINDILDLSKIEAGRFDLREEEVELRYLVDGVMRIVAPRAEQAKVELTCDDISDDVVVRCDERAIKQVLINLLSNAVKFTEPDKTVRVAFERGRTHFTLSVVDEGIGMAPEDIPRALEPFRQIDGTLTRTYEGTGLGLPLARRLTELHDGTLTIESELGAGTSVIIELPNDRFVEFADPVSA